ncbi:Cenp-O kinetochore centromere component-domain-containing protein [Spinellus fusiger]|nr:Cenp-O kinetochore centromere component-domain-containing protein [Spinellus fusiger]
MDAMEDYTPFTMVAPTDDSFLPKGKEKLKAQILDLRRQCKALSLVTQVKEEHRKLKCAVMEEKIARIVATKFSEEIKDPTRYKASEMKDVQQKILDQMMTATEARCVQEVIGYYRLCGRTTFNFNDQYHGIRLDTFYKQVYREPYYLLFRKDPIYKKKWAIEKHTIPLFIPLKHLEKTFLHDKEAFLRTLQDFLLAYVSRREQINEFVTWAESQTNIVDIETESRARSHLQFKIKTDAGELQVELRYDDLTADQPTETKIMVASGVEEYDFAHEESTFCSNKVMDAFNLLFG